MYISAIVSIVHFLTLSRNISEKVQFDTSDLSSRFETDLAYLKWNAETAAT